jgi:hypothetical protein
MRIFACLLVKFVQYYDNTNQLKIPVRTQIGLVCRTVQLLQVIYYELAVPPRDTKVSVSLRPAELSYIVD